MHLVTTKRELLCSRLYKCVSSFSRLHSRTRFRCYPVSGASRIPTTVPSILVIFFFPDLESTGLEPGLGYTCYNPYISDDPHSWTRMLSYRGRVLRRLSLTLKGSRVEKSGTSPTIGSRCLFLFYTQYNAREHNTEAEVGVRPDNTRCSILLG
ncbi:hypothetical protein KQX54_015036 [Cotesia glomerata]|uniref:Uncharacterized protein n=1 Tax=Cotesia glomerata TaxID=32391 RepID=A0AAV7IX02_COTGL|nr:hypothetical protein KQX54_015036 [Cotesia glomerata]